MSTTVRITEQARERLQRLQAGWRRTLGEGPSQQALLDQGLAYLEAHMDEFLAEATWHPLTNAEIRALEKRVIGRFGQLSGDIDSVVYGD
ncbi:MAG: hypothetical protein ACYDDF_14635 [Thermoplasmatota archaeon]